MADHTAFGRCAGQSATRLKCLDPVQHRNSEGAIRPAPKISINPLITLARTSGLGIVCYSFALSPMSTLSFLTGTPAAVLHRLAGVVGKQGDLASRKRFNGHGSINDLVIVDW